MINNVNKLVHIAIKTVQSVKTAGSLIAAGFINSTQTSPPKE